MKVILQKDVPNLGDAGELKDVADGYARNYLIPRKLVVAAIGNSAKAMEHQNRMRTIRAEKRHAEMESYAGKLKEVESIEVPVRVGQKGKLYGSVTPMQISQVLADQGFAIEKRKIDMGGENIRSPGKYNIKIKLAEKIIVPLTVNVIPDEASEAEAQEAEELRIREEERLRALERSENPVEEEASAEEPVESEDAEATEEEESSGD